MKLFFYILCCLNFLLLSGCKKNKDVDQSSYTKYYFKFSVDTINIDERMRTDYLNRIILKSLKQESTTHFQIEDPNARFGFYHLKGGFQVINIAKGEFVAHEFFLEVGEGMYSSSRTDQPITLVINEYTLGTWDKPGIIEGTFSGVVTYSKDPDPYKTFPISGSFAFPSR